jgi:hypothetical protein
MCGRSAAGAGAGGKTGGVTARLPSASSSPRISTGALSVSCSGTGRGGMLIEGAAASAGGTDETRDRARSPPCTSPVCVSWTWSRSAARLRLRAGGEADGDVRVGCTIGERAAAASAGGGGVIRAGAAAAAATAGGGGGVAVGARAGVTARGGEGYGNTAGAGAAGGARLSESTTVRGQTRRVETKNCDLHTSFIGWYCRRWLCRKTFEWNHTRPFHLFGASIFVFTLELNEDITGRDILTLDHCALIQNSCICCDKQRTNKSDRFRFAPSRIKRTNQGKKQTPDEVDSLAQRA